MADGIHFSKHGNQVHLLRVSLLYLLLNPKHCCCYHIFLLWSTQVFGYTIREGVASVVAILNRGAAQLRHEKKVHQIAPVERAGLC